VLRGAIAIACLVLVNEAGRMSMSTSSMSLRRFWKGRKAQNVASMSTIKHSMTTEKALAIMPKVRGSTSSFLSLIQEKLGTKKRVQMHHAAPGGAKGLSDSDYTGGTNVALARINDMMLETIEKHDFEDIRCHDYNNSQLIVLSEIEEDRKILETLGEGAASGKSDAFAQVNKYKGMAFNQMSEIRKWQSQCSTESKELQAQYDVASGDLNVMFKVLEMVQCETNNVFLQTSKDNQAVLLTCQNSRTGQTYQKVSVHGKKLKTALANLKHPKVVKLLREVLGADPAYGVMNATTVPDDSMAEEKCSLANSTKCPELRERFLNIQGGIEDTIMQIEHFMNNHKLRCAHIEANMKDELSLYIESVDRYTVLEKKAVETMGEYDLQMQEKKHPVRADV